MNGQFLARCLHGLEWALAAEIDHLGARPTAVGHRELRFDDPSPTAERLKLRVADDVFLFVGDVGGVDKTRAALARLEARSNTIPWRPALRALQAIRPAASWHHLTVVASFLGKRNYNRYELEDSVGPRVASALGLPFKASRELRSIEQTLTVRLHVVDQQATFALRLFDEPLHRRDYKVRSRPGTLHPPLAAAMAMIAGLRDGAAVLDPFCGIGTIAIESKRLQPTARVWGSDLDDKRLLDAEANARAAGVDVNWVRADAGRLPFERGAFARLVTNPPWGGAVDAAGSLATAGSASLGRGFAAVLADDPRVVVLVDAPMTDGRRFSVEGLELQFEASVSVFGRHPRLLVFGSAPPGTKPFDVDAPFGRELARRAAWVAERLASS
jgi:23S rRNA G2445 N2-methylase RlmL